MKLYTIEFGKFYLINNKIYRGCKNQPAFLNKTEADAEINYYIQEYFSSIFFKNKTDNDVCGYYLEVYEDDVNLSLEEIEYIKENNCYTESGTNLIKEMVISINKNFINCECENYSD